MNRLRHRGLVLVSAALGVGCSDPGIESPFDDASSLLSGDSAEARLQAPDDGVSGVLPSFSPSSQQASVVTVMVKANGDPIAVVQGKTPNVELTASQKQNIRNSLKATQSALQPQIQALGGQVKATYQAAYNGLRVEIARSQLSALAALPGVVAVRPLLPVHRDNTNGVPGIGAPLVWGGAAGYHGEGVKIAVIDTGIDYTHADFGGPGTPAAYEAAYATSAEAADASVFGPAAPKVKGGIDLVGNDYDGDNDPAPDPNPLDCNSHGTHVGGTAAGFGVLADGTTFSGPWNASTYSDNSFAVGPGVAPGADLYAVRVFGCEGPTNVVVDAIEWAVDNGMDVINMSLGSSFGTADDPSAEAADNAVRAGVVVVASAGNSGSSPYITGSPASATRAISVAASDPIASFPGAALTLSAAGVATTTLSSINANGASFSDGTTLPVKVLRDATGNVSIGCDPAEYVDVGGKLVVTRRGVCARVARAVYGQQAGALAVVMINNTTAYPPFEGAITSNPDTGEPYTVTIPFLGVRSSDGAALVARDGGSAAMANSSIPNPSYRAIADFSSGGPRNGDGMLKPDVTAAGVSILSALVGTGTGGARFSGTSMAAPHVAGAAALARQAHPTWTAEEIKSALLNSGDPTLVAGYKTSRAGSGAVQVQSAVATSAVAYADAAATTLNFGVAEMKVDFAKTKPVLVRNRSASPVVFDVAVTNAQGSPHTMTPAATTLTVAANSVAAVDTTLTVSAGTAGNSAAFREVAGLITLTPAGGGNGGAALRVPYYLVPRAFSNVHTALQGKLGNAAPSTTATFSNVDGAIGGTAELFAWGLSDGNDAKGSNDMRAVGLESLPSPTAADPNRRLLVFAINTWQAWSNAATNEFDIYVDVNADDVDDYVLVGVDNGLITTGIADGRMNVAVISLVTNAAALTNLVSAPTDSSTLLLALRSSHLCMADTPCLSTASPRLSYQAVSFDLYGTAVDEIPARAKFHAWSPAITQGTYVEVAPNTTATAPVAVSPAEWVLTPALGVMVVSPDNKNGKSEAQLISVSM